MRCEKCLQEFEEFLIEDSHDVPCYLFYKEIGRNNKKNKADKFKRHWLCKVCHEVYEDALNFCLIKKAIKFSNSYYGS